MFSDFSKVVHARYNEMAKGELFIVDVLDIFDSYLAAFPTGTNPIFRERTEHDCSCCKNFIRNLGAVVSISPDGTVHTVWDDCDDLPHPYNVVAKTLAAIVRQSPIRSVYRTKERSYGAEVTYEGSHPWHHFHGKVSDKHFSTTPEKARGDLNTTAQVFERGLKELRLSDLDTVIDLIEAKALYKGDEFLPKVKQFRALKAAYDASDNQNLFVWSNISSPGTRFRNSAIGQLLVELSEDTELEVAVAKYENMVSGTNYKRSSALVSPKMVENALAKLDEMGLREAATERRHARFSDVSVNDVLFVDNSVKLKDSLADLLVTAKPAPTKIENPTPISAEDFFAMSHKSISALVENRHNPNFMSITAGAAGLFPWNNGFSWSYDGDTTDSVLRQKVQSAGGRVDGVLRFSHLWNDEGRNSSLMDLHVFLPGSGSHREGSHDLYPSGQRVGWNRRNDPVSGGIQDVDYTAPAPQGYVPVENITFPSLAKLKDGDYTFKIHNWQLRNPTNSGFKAEIEVAGQVYQYDHPAPLGNKEWVTLAVATLKNGQWTLDHKHPTTTSTRDKWGIKTETLVPVEAMMLSPNHWLGQQIGNKHWFFILRDAKNPDPVRGIYNEYLRPDLNEHRKVFEVLGSKTKAPFAEDQLSGLGFSSTQRNSLKVVADGRAYEVQF